MASTPACTEIVNIKAKHNEWGQYGQNGQNGHVFNIQRNVKGCFIGVAVLDAPSDQADVHARENGEYRHIADGSHHL